MMKTEIVFEFAQEEEEPKKLYSQKAIGLGVFFGGPVVAGILMRKNFLTLGKERAALHALMIGIIATVVIFSLLVALPQEVIDKIPSFLFPVIYTGIILWILEVTQGSDLRKHQEQQGVFFKIGKVMLIGLFWMGINIGLVFGTVYLSDAVSSFNAETYSSMIGQYLANEEKALKVFQIEEQSSDDELLEGIKNGIALYRENGIIIEEMIRSKGISTEGKEIIDKLKKYNDLRLGYFELLYKAMIENTDKYNVRLARIIREIADVQGDLQ